MNTSPDGASPAKTLEILQRVFGHSSFRNSQAQIIERSLAGQHSLVLMPTGMGKSLCYQLPAVATGGLCLVISPLIALMKDQVDGLRAIGVDAGFINSSLGRAERERRQQQLRSGQYCILYVTPERFRKQEFLEVLSERRVRLLAIDEAHCVSEWGHDFRPDYTRIGEFRRLMGSPPTILLTATATPRVQEDILAQCDLNPAEVRVFHEGVERPNLRLEVTLCHGDDEKLQRIRERLETARGSAIVYFSLIRTLERFSAELAEAGVEHLCYHGRMDAGPRKRVQEAFMEGRVPVVLATNAFGMGIDKEDIGLIVHAELPGSLESYAQETGRAGRDGLPATCVLLYDEQDLLIQMDFIDWANPSGDYLDRLLHLLSESPEEVNSNGLEWLRAQLSHRNRSDFRLETALNLLDRHGVTEGDLAARTLCCTEDLGGDFADSLFDEAARKRKKLRDQQRLHQLVTWIRLESCRRQFLHSYFGFEDPPCGNCDACDTREPQ
ncbi:MAG: ATP-dependent DNA helicase RecQ [Calditrichaeota bacterium]|nr:ATP-dependent DNA helicase RecQ [Calditrichota bacterium]